MTSKTDVGLTPSGGKWSIVVDQVWFPCLGSSPNLLVYSSEKEARVAFKSLTGLRMLIDDSGAEVLAAPGAPWKRGALKMIRQDLKRTQRTKTKNLCDMTEFDFLEENAFLPDDFIDGTAAVELPKRRSSKSDAMSTDADLDSSRTTRSVFGMPQGTGTQVVALPRKRLPSDMESTDVDLESSQTTRSAFTMSPVEICQSTSSSVYHLLDLRSRKGSIDICQSTTSSVYRLLNDLDSRHDSVFIED
jgi:hypothetical protein